MSKKTEVSTPSSSTPVEGSALAGFPLSPMETAGIALLLGAGIFCLFKWSQHWKETKCDDKDRDSRPASTPAVESASNQVMDVAQLPVIDLRLLHSKSNTPDIYRRECEKALEAFHTFGCCVLRDERVNNEDNNTFLDMMERYFMQSDGKKDARPAQAFQVGVTPEGQERARNHAGIMSNYRDVVSPNIPEPDKKWRYFWQIGVAPQDNDGSIESTNVIPDGFPEWERTMETWGDKMLASIFDLSIMLADAMGLESNTFTTMMHAAPHKLAPTGSDLRKYPSQGSVLAAFHYDLNFITIHGKSRYPGLKIWLRDGTPLLVKVPDGCLLVQAGKMLEHVTGGFVLAGFHEVIVNEATVAVIERRRREGKPQWRISSTLFGHIARQVELKPLGRFANKETNARYPPICANDFVMNELRAINLANDAVVERK